MVELKVLGGLRLESASFSQPKPLLLLTYLAVEGSQQRRHLAELFWQDGNRMKKLTVLLTRLRQGVGQVLETDTKKAWTSVPSDVGALLESLDKSDWQKANELYTGAFLEGVILDDWSSELEEWVYSTREYLAERVQYGLLNLAEDFAKRQNFAKAGEFAERAYQLPGLTGTDLNNLKRLYPIFSAAQHGLAPRVKKEAESFSFTLQLTTEEARATFKQNSRANTLPTRNTSFIGRDEELADIAALLSKPKVSLLTLLGPAGIGKTRLALQFAHEQQKLTGFKDGIYFITLDALDDANFLLPTLLSHFGLTQGKTEPLEQLTDSVSDKQCLLILDNFEHLTEGSSLLSALLSKCPNLKILVTSREKLKLEEEYHFVLEGLPYPATASEDAKLSDAVQLFSERAQQVQPHFDVDQNLGDILHICNFVDGLPLGLELSASWLRIMSCRDIAAELEQGLELLVSTSENIPERHRNLRTTFEQSWKLLSSKEQEVLRKLAVFVGGFRREAAREVAGATIPVLASLVDKSLLRVLPNGRYDRHPILYQFTNEKLAEHTHEQSEASHAHTTFYLELAQEAERHFFSREAKTYLSRFDEELDNVRSALARVKGETGLRLITSLAEFWYARGLYQEVRNHITTFLVSSESNSLLYIKGLYTLADFAWEQGDFEAAKIHLDEALSLAHKLGDQQAIAQILRYLARIYQYNYSDHTKARVLYEESITLSELVGDHQNKATALKLLGLLVSGEGDFEAAKTFYEESLTLWRELEHTSGIADVLNNMAVNLNNGGEQQQATSLYEESLKVYRELNEKEGIALVLYNLGDVALSLNHYPKATAALSEALLLWRELGDQRGIAYTLNGLGQLALYKDDYGEAQNLFAQSYHLLHLQGYKIDIAFALRFMALALHASGKPTEAEQTFRESLEVGRSINAAWDVAHTGREFAILEIELKKFEEARALLAESLHLAKDMKSERDSVLVLEGFALLETALGHTERAASLWGVCDSLRQTLGSVRNPLEQKRYEHTMKQLSQHFGKKLDRMFKRGQTMGLVEALDLACFAVDDNHSQKYWQRKRDSMKP